MILSGDKMLFWTYFITICNFLFGQDVLLELFEELQASLRPDIRAISRGFQTHLRQALRAKIGMQIWFSAINSLVLPSSSVCCPWDNINELALHYSWSPTDALRKGK